jgi:hypothetical protein
MDEEETEKLQGIVDKAKTYSLLNNIHNLTPPKQQQDEEVNIELIKALDSHPKIQEIYLEAQGMIYDKKQKEAIQINNPYMNSHGARKLVSILLKFSQADWSNISEEYIGPYQDHFFRETYPHFTFWYDVYDLKPKDFDYVKVTLQMFLLSSFSKGKSGKMLNLLGRTYSEDSIQRIMGGQFQQSKKKEGFLEKHNPFK